MTESDFFQLKSMTAFGRGVSACEYGRFIVEIQSVNRRYLEININLPRQFSRYEIDIRKHLSAHVGRGALNVTLSWKKEGNQPVTVTPNFGLAKGLNEAWKTLAHELGLKEQISLALLAQEKDIFLFSEESGEQEVIQKTLFEALDIAIHDLTLMKQVEGAALIDDLKQRLNQLQEAIAYVDEHAKEAPEKYRLKLASRLEELFSGSPENEERILREIALYAERVDITEEIVRFKSHLSQFETMLERSLESRIECRGKTLDFLLQELHRESNTIGSKTTDVNTAQRVVFMKGELEKMKEQVQNIE